MRTILVLAGLLAVGAVPVTGAAQHGARPATPAVKTGAAATHAATPAKPSDTPVDKHAANASAKPATEKAATVADVKPLAKAGTHERKASDQAVEKTAVTARTVVPKSELEAVFDRIAQKIDGAEVMPGGLRISSGSPVTPARAAEGRSAQSRAARDDAASRLHLTWRCSVVWPTTLWPAETHGTEPAHDVSHITLAWQ